MRGISARMVRLPMYGDSSVHLASMKGSLQCSPSMAGTTFGQMGVTFIPIGIAGAETFRVGDVR